MKKYFLFLLLSLYSLPSFCQSWGAEEAGPLWDSLCESFMELFQEDYKPFVEKNFKEFGWDVVFTPKYVKSSHTLELWYDMSFNINNADGGTEMTSIIHEQVVGSLKNLYNQMELITIKTGMVKAGGHIVIKVRIPVNGQYTTFSREILPSDLSN